jgi:hypothetical protein
MVKWREDIEFIYILIMLVSSIVVFFTIYDFAGFTVGAVVVAVLLIAEIGVAFVAFETEAATKSWERLEKKNDKQVSA